MATLFNLGDTSDTVKSRIREKMHTLYPDIDFSENTSYDDIIINPVADIMADAYAQIDNLTSAKSIAQASSMSTQDLDDLCEGSYWMSRIQGQKASTTLTLSFINLEVEGQNFDLIIPAGQMFSNTDGYQYQSVRRMVVPKSEFYKYFNKKTSRYDISLYVEATLVGSVFNTSYKTITQVDSTLDKRLVAVTNTAAVTNGVNAETNAEYADRVKKFYYTRQLGTAAGYRSYVLEVAPAVTDVKVYGYGDSCMTRDIYTFGDSEILPITSIDFATYKVYINVTDGTDYALPAPRAVQNGSKSYITVIGLSEQEIEVTSSNYSVSGNVITLNFASGSIKPDKYWKSIIYNPNSLKEHQHLGGKVDIYLKNTESSQYSATNTFLSSLLVLQKAYSSTIANKITATASYTDTSGAEKVVTLTSADYTVQEINSVFFSTAMYVGYTAIMLKDAFVNQHIVASKTSSFKVSVSHTDSDVLYSRYYEVGKCDVSLSSPLSEYSVWDNLISVEIDSLGELNIYNDAASNTDGVTKGTDITYNQSGVKGTTDENTIITIVPDTKKHIPNAGGSSSADAHTGGIAATIYHKVNKSVADASALTDLPNKRSLCSDVMVSATPKIQVEAKIEIRLVEGARYRSEQARSLIKTSIREFFDQKQVGSGLADSDLIGHLYSDPKVYTMIAFVNRPLNSSSTSFNIIESIKEVTTGGTTTTTLYYRARENTDGLDNNTDALPIYDTEQPVLYEPTFQVNFI